MSTWGEILKLFTAVLSAIKSSIETEDDVPLPFMNVSLLECLNGAIWWKVYKNQLKQGYTQIFIVIQIKQKRNLIG